MKDLVLVPEVGSENRRMVDMVMECRASSVECILIHHSSQSTAPESNRQRGSKMEQRPRQRVRAHSLTGARQQELKEARQVT